MQGECNICHKTSDLRLGACFNCAEIQSILHKGTDMYDKKFLEKEHTIKNIKQINAIILALTKANKLK